MIALTKNGGIFTVLQLKIERNISVERTEDVERGRDSEGMLKAILQIKQTVNNILALAK